MIMPAFVTLRLSLEPYMLSILRVVVGLLYMVFRVGPNCVL